MMNNFTPRAQQVLALARKEADRFNHNYVGTEHLLLGLIKLGQGVAVNVLTKLGLDLETVRMQVEQQVGSALLGVQSITFVSTLAVFGKATNANIVYASRGLLSVVLVWMVGHWFQNAEQHLGPKVMRWRLIGALLMLSAIVLVVV